MKRPGWLLALVLVACGQSSAVAVPTPTTGATPEATATATHSTRPTADWPEYHRNAARTGVGPTTPTLNAPARAWSVGVDGEVYASPLIVGGRVIVATENDTVYSLDLTTGSTLWRAHLAPPVDASTLPCGNITPVTGITGTPVADPEAGRLYVVAFVSGHHHMLFTLSLADGSIIKQQSVDPAGSDPAVQQERGALSLTGGFVYVPLGGLYGDCGAYHGYLIAVPLGSGGMLVFRTPSARESGIWSPMGATMSASGALFAATGNGSFSSSFDYSNSVLQLSPDLKLQAFFAPMNWKSLAATDTDLGSVGVALLPATGVLVAIGKQGVAYLLKASSPGGIGGQLAAQQVCSGAWGGSAWAGTAVFLPCIDGLVALGVSPTAFSVAWRAPQVRLASPIVAAGAVWAIDQPSATLYALEPATGAVLYGLALGAAEHFSTPAATEGYIVAPAGSRIVAVRVAG